MMMIIKALLTLTTLTLLLSGVSNALIVPDPIIHFGVGAVAGGVGAVAAYPFDYIKSQLQTQQGKETWGSDGIQALKDTLQTQGPLRLYKGVGVQVMGVAPEKGIKLGVNDVLASMFQSQMGFFPLWGQILSGSVAGACQIVASSPLEVLKVGLQTSDRSLAEVWTEVGGFGGLFRGSGACMARDIVFTAICFPLYTYLVQELHMPTFFAGAVSGSISSFTATPADVIKTRILSQRRAAPPSTVAAAPMAQRTAAVFASVSAVKSLEGVAQLAVVPTMTNSSTFDISLTVPRAATTTTAVGSTTAFFTNQQFVNDQTDNPWTMFQRIVETEGAGALMSGGRERFVGAIPRFGATMAVHDLLEQVAHNAGWLAHSVQ